ncbi:hypothetical protein ERJ75_001353500 [Trypanosoma vivax]|nr:hypothetical protein ERJ75_001353500 [Trypanosoma vivax]
MDARCVTENFNLLKNGCEVAIRLLKGSSEPSFVSPASPSGGASLLSKLIVSQSQNVIDRLRDVRAICEESFAIVQQARRRADGGLSTNSVGYPSSVEGACEALLVDYCKELAAELQVLRSERRSAAPCVDFKMLEYETLQSSVRNSLDTLFPVVEEYVASGSCLSTPRNSPSTLSLCVPGGWTSNRGNIPTSPVIQSEISIGEQLERCALVASRLLREKDRSATLVVRLLQEARAESNPDEKDVSVKESLFNVASDVVRILQSARDELEATRVSLKQSQMHNEDLRKRFESQDIIQSAAMASRDELNSGAERQLTEAIERQVAATAQAARAQRSLAEFAGSIAAVTLFAGTASGASTETGVLMVDEDLLAQIVEHCTAVMREAETARVRIKCLTSEIEGVRLKLDESETEAREAQLKMKRAESVAASRFTEMESRVVLLENELHEKSLAVEKAHQCAHKFQEQLDALQSEMTGAAQLHETQRETMDKNLSSLLRDKAEMEQQMDDLHCELRETTNEVQDFLQKIGASSLSGAKEKFQVLLSDSTLNALINAEEKCRAVLVRKWSVRFITGKVPPCSVCCRIATALSETTLDRLPACVESLQQQVKEHSHLLGYPERAPGPSRAALIETVRKLSGTLGHEEPVHSESFLDNLASVLADRERLREEQEKKISDLDWEVKKNETLLQTISSEAIQALGILKNLRLPAVEESTVDEQGQLHTICKSSSNPLSDLKTLHNECCWVADQLITHEQNKKEALEALRSFCHSHCIVEASTRAAGELKRLSALLAELRPELHATRMQLEEHRSCVESSVQALSVGGPLDGINLCEALQQHAASTGAELRQLRGIISTLQRILGASGYSVQQDNVCQVISDVVANEREQRERVEQMEANNERAERKQRQLLKELEDERRNVQRVSAEHMAEADRRNIGLSEEIAELKRKCDEEWACLVACGAEAGCTLDDTGVAANCGKTLKAVRALALSRDASVNELQLVKAQLASMEVCNKKTQELCLAAQEEQSRVREEGNLLREQLAQALERNKKYHVLFPQLLGRMEEILSVLVPTMSVCDNGGVSEFTTDAPVDVRAQLLCQQLLNASNAACARLRDLDAEVAALKEDQIRHQQEISHLHASILPIMDSDNISLSSCSVKHLGQIVREKLEDIVCRNQALVSEMEALRIDRDALAKSMQSAQGQLSDSNSQLQQLIGQRDMLERENSDLRKSLDGFNAFASDVAQKLCDSPYYRVQEHGDKVDLNYLRELLDATHVSLQRSKAGVLVASEGVDEVAEEPRGTAAGEQSLLVQLQRVTHERDVLLSESEKLVEQVQNILEEHIDVQKELFVDNDADGKAADDITVGAIVQACVEKLSECLSSKRLFEGRINAFQQETTRMSLEIVSLKEDRRALRQSSRAAEDECTRQAAELEGIHRQLQQLFTDALRTAGTELQLKLPTLTDTSPTGALEGLRSLFEYIVAKQRYGIASSDEEDLKNKLREEKRSRAKEVRGLLRAFTDHVAPYVDASHGRNTNDVANNNSENSEEHKPRLATQQLIAAGESLHVSHSNTEQVIWTWLRYIGADFPSPPRPMDLPTLSAVLKETSAKVIERMEVLRGALHTASVQLGIQALDTTSSAEQTADWITNFQLGALHAQRGLIGLERLLDSLESIVSSHGGTLEVSQCLSPSYSHSVASQCSPKEGLELLLIDANKTQADTSKASVVPQDVMELRQHVVLHALQELILQLERRNHTLTSEWQALVDQNNRLLHERRQDEEEHVRVREHMQELRRVVQWKIEEDRKVEQSLQELDVHLDLQARELAMKYRADHEAIVQQFSQLRGAIYKAMKPSQQQLSASAAARKLM